MGKGPWHTSELYYLLQYNNLLPCPLPHPQCNITSLLYLEAISMWHHDHHSIPAFTTETGRWDETQACILYEMRNINACPWLFWRLITFHEAEYGDRVPVSCTLCAENPVQLANTVDVSQITLLEEIILLVRMSCVGGYVNLNVGRWAGDG